MRQAIDHLTDDPALRTKLGDYGRELVLTRFSLRAAAETQEEEYRHAVANSVPRSRLAGDATRSAAGLLRYKVRRKIDRWRGTAAVDDANAQPLIAANRAAEAGQVTT
jgi:hypothetical protein